MKHSKNEQAKHNNRQNNTMIKDKHKLEARLEASTRSAEATFYPILFGLLTLLQQNISACNESVTNNNKFYSRPET